MIFRFGAFEFSIVSGELRKHGILVRLSPQPFQVLTTLIEHAGEIVTRDDLQNRLWGQDHTSVEFDAGLNRCIRQIRAALNDDADSPRYIETVPRKGYRFIAAVEKSQVQGTVVSETAPVHLELPPQSAVYHRRVWPVVLLLAVVVALAGGIWFLRNRSKLSPNLHSVPLAVAHGDQYTPTFSPDGRQVAFIWNGERQDNFDIYLKLIGSSSAPLRLTTSADIDYSPAWSPDGRWIAFCRGGDSYGGAVLLIPALGGAERKVIGLHTLGSPGQRSLSWSNDSKSLVVDDRPADQTTKGLYVWNVETGERRQLTTPTPEEVDMQPAVSPDGHDVAFTRDTGRGISSVMIVPFSGGRPRTLRMPFFGTKPGNFYNARPAWTPDGSHVVFASNASGSRHLWLVSAHASATPIELAALGSSVEDAAISTAGQLAFMHNTHEANLWKLELGTSGNSPPKAVEIGGSTRLEQSPTVAPDGSRIAFDSDVSGYSEIWTSRADGSDPVQLTFLQNPVTGSPDWSPDGEHIVFDSRASGRPQLYIIPANGGKPSQLSSGKASEVVPRWSPDGRFIYYSSEQSGRMEIWRRPAAGGSPQQITFDGGSAAVPSRDGESLYYRASNETLSSLWELRLATGKCSLVSSSVADRAYTAAPGGAYFFSGSNSEAKRSLFFYDKQTHQKSLIFESDKPAEIGMAVTPNGRSLYYSQRDRSEHDLFLVKEFWKE